ncbi:unnamed protein product, partial [Prorocentrum cordatum]
QVSRAGRRRGGLATAGAAARDGEVPGGGRRPLGPQGGRRARRHLAQRGGAGAGLPARRRAAVRGGGAERRRGQRAAAGAGGRRLAAAHHAPQLLPLSGQGLHRRAGGLRRGGRGRGRPRGGGRRGRARVPAAGGPERRGPGAGGVHAERHAERGTGVQRPEGAADVHRHGCSLRQLRLCRRLSGPVLRGRSGRGGEELPGGTGGAKSSREGRRLDGPCLREASIAQVLPGGLGTVDLCVIPLSPPRDLGPCKFKLFYK